MLSLTCKRCQQEITGTDEDDLVARVQEHVAGHGHDHPRAHSVSPEHVRRRLRRQEEEQSED
ncbi:MAG TPA: hypothetical protein VI357_13785 [Mycobacteriales bacterium]